MLLTLRSAKLQALVLTFDDGPGNRLTPAILALLSEYDVRATFFLLGRNIVGREHIVRQISTEGHEICSHGYSHLHYWKVPPMRTIKDIKQGWRAIDAALESKRSKYPFRPPNGKLNTISLLYLLFCRVPIVYWSLDSGDTFQLKPDSRRIAFMARKTGGAVVLVHDFDRSDGSVDWLVLESVRLALATAKQMNMRVMTVSELLHSQR